jgi:cell division protein FtsQ
MLESLRGMPVIGRPMLLLTLALIVIGAAAGLLSSGYFQRTSHNINQSISAAFVSTGFAVDKITIAGQERTTPDAVYAALQTAPGDSIFGFNAADARKRLLALPWVADAVVRRHFPGRIEVTLIEKRPFAQWQNDGQLSVVERSGAVIVQDDLREFAKLPLVVGAGAPEAAAPLLDAIGGYRAVSARLRAAQRVSKRRWDLLLEGGVTVKLPEEGWEAQLAELERLIIDEGILERDIEMIDLRFPDTYVFRLHNGDSQPVSRNQPV